MILGLPTPCFVEIDEAVDALQRERGDDRPVVFHWQAAPNKIPPGSIVYNFDYPDIHFFEPHMRLAAERASEVWDFSERGVARWRDLGIEARYVPAGFHPSMVRFDRARDLQLDVVFVGCLNERRNRVLDALRARGLRVALAPPDRKVRDAMLARARTSLNMLFYEDGAYPVLRALHLASNQVPSIDEACPEIPPWRAGVPYDEVVEAVVRNVEERRVGGQWPAMVLPG